MRKSSTTIEDAWTGTVQLVNFIIHSSHWDDLSNTKKYQSLLSFSLARWFSLLLLLEDELDVEKTLIEKRKTARELLKKRSDRSLLSIDKTLVDEWFLREEQLFRNLELNSIAKLCSLKWTSLQRSTIAHWLIATRTRIVLCLVMSNRSRRWEIQIEMPKERIDWSTLSNRQRRMNCLNLSFSNIFDKWTKQKWTYGQEIIIAFTFRVIVVTALKQNCCQFDDRGSKIRSPKYFKNSTRRIEVK